MTAPIKDGVAYIQDLHDKTIKNTQEVEECAAAKQAPKCKHLNEHFTEEAIEIAPFVDFKYKVPSGDIPFLPAGDSHLL